MANLSSANLTCEYLTNPRGVDAAQPRLTWALDSSSRGQAQTAYRILVASDPSLLDQGTGDLWDSGRVESAQSVGIAYGGRELVSGERCHWKVQVWDQAGETGDSSAIGFWQMGLLNKSDWKAAWISAATPRDTQVDGLTLPSAPYLRNIFAVDKPVRSATIYATARGVYELHLNGSRVGDELFAPGWTDYNKRIQYQAYDVTSNLRQGENAIGAILGDGWYCGYVGYGKKRDFYGSEPELLLQLQIEFIDGSMQRVASDGSWSANVGAIAYSDMLQGEFYEACKEPSGWDQPGFNAAGWHPVAARAAQETGARAETLVATRDPKIRILQDLAAKEITQPTPGVYIFDIGQNMVGWARLKVSAPTGTRIQLRFAEMLNPDGTLYITNLRAARATDTYVCKGGGQVEIWEPHFTFHGFRYVEMTGYPREPTMDMLTGQVIGSDTPTAGAFSCSEAMVNQLQSNIVWGQRGNFLSIPTDCPQRDERLGWMGDAQIFVRTATYNCDVQAFFEKWVQDVEDAQSDAGGYPDVAPRLVDDADGAPAWGDAGIIVPWTIWQVYGDKNLLEKHWKSMEGWMEYLTSANPDGLWTQRRNNDFGDWLSIAADTPKDLLATAYYAYDAKLMALMARALGRAADADKYEALFAHIKEAFNKAYVEPNGKIKGDTQTDYVIALHFGLLPEDQRQAATQHLVDAIRAKNDHLSTGFVGVGYLCPTLTNTGNNDIAYKLLLNKTFPSWGYSIEHGATTIWERWDGWTQDNGFQDPGMNSFNHYSLGSVGEWLYRYVAGIDTDPAHPGFERIIIAPHPGPGLTWAQAEYQSIRGKIASAWKTENGKLTLDVTIPANTSATVVLQTHEGASVTESGRPAKDADGISSISQKQDTTFVTIGSGTYHFQVN